MSEQAKEFRNLVSELKNTVSTVGEDHKQELATMSAEQKASVEAINGRMDELELSMEKSRRSNSTKSAGYEHLDTFKDAFFRFVKGDRNGINDIQCKSGYHSVKSDNLVRFDFASAGALLLPEEVSTEMLRNIQEVTPAMQLATVSNTNAPQRKRTLRKGTPGGDWLDEEGENTKQKPEYRTVTLTPQKWAARYGFSIEQEQDSAFDIVGELTSAFREDFMVDVGKAFISGDGNGKPTGVLNEAKEASYSGLTLTTDKLIQMKGELLDAYESNGSWLFNRKTRTYIRTLVLSSTNGLQYTWEPDFQRGTPTLLLGAPIYIAADADMAGVVSGNFTDLDKPILFGDFRRGYELTLHTDMYMIDDMYSESSRFVRNLNIMARIDGKPLEADVALVALKMNA